MDSYAICSKCKGDCHVNELKPGIVAALGTYVTGWYCVTCAPDARKPRKIPALAALMKATKPRRKKRAA